MEPQRNLEAMVPPQAASQQLLRRDGRTVPYPALSENTLVLSDSAVVGTRDSPDGQLSLMVRWDPCVGIVRLRQQDLSMPVLEA